jgi:predicted DNA-binding transcriptional regulator YafY
LRRSDRLFEIIQLLRSAKRPLTAAQIAAALEVNVRTVYRDIAALQARRVPIEGATGIGYVLRDFDLPPLMFTADEIEAITVGVRLVRRTGDTGLQRAAEAVLAKVRTVVPQRLREAMHEAPFLVSDVGARAVDISCVREAIRERSKPSDRVCRPAGAAHKPCDPPDRGGLFRGSDGGRRLVRTALRLSPFPSGSYRRTDNPRRVVLR